MNRLIAVTLAVMLMTVVLTTSTSATSIDPDAVRPKVSKSEIRSADDGGWVVPPLEVSYDDNPCIVGGLLNWTPDLGQHLILNYFLDTGEVNNGTDNEEPTGSCRPVDQR